MTPPRTRSTADSATSPDFAWNLADIHETLVEGLRARALAADEEQAVQGIDALSEIALHAMLADILVQTEFGVLRERVYPGQPGVAAEKARPKDSARMRCDIVLTPRKGMKLTDPVEQLRERDALVGTLFAETPLPTSKPTLTAAQALWIEVKTVGQYCFRRDIPVPNTTYGADLTQAMFDDLAKLSHEPLIHQGTLALILFTADRETAEHDVGVAMHRVLDKGVAFRAPIRGGFPITDRIGNAWCCVAVVPSVSV